MNEKKNDKPVEMPARGRPRKRDYSVDPVFKNDFMHKPMFNSPQGFTNRENSQEEMNLSSMCPYNVGDQSILLDQFNKIGDVFNSSNGQRDEKYQISPKDVQNSKMNHFYNSSSQAMERNPDLLSPNINHRIEGLGINEQNYQNNNMMHKMNNMPVYDNSSNNYQQYSQHQNMQPGGYSQFQFSPPLYDEQQKPAFYNQDPSNMIDRRTSIYQEYNKGNNTQYYTNSRPKLNNVGYYKSPQNPNFFRQNQNYFRTPLLNDDHIENSWIYKKKRKNNNPIMWNYVKNGVDNFQPLVHPSKYSSLDYIQGNDIFSRRSSSERDCNNTILPLFLNSNKELNDEYLKVINNFQKRVSELDFTNVTVHQLKLLMREFGLNHIGKKNELIDRAKNTLKKIDISITNAKKRENEEEKLETKEDDDYENVFF